MITINELFRNLGIPEDLHRREVEIFNPINPQEVYWGKPKPGYNGYVAGCKSWDPKNQLTRYTKASEDQYAWTERYTYDYAGKAPAAVTWDSSSVNSNKKGILLFLPEGLPVLMKAKEKEIITYDIPDSLKKKWIWEVSKKEGRNPFYWREYARVWRGVADKAIVYASYQFARERPTNEVGVTHDPWGHYRVTNIVQKGKVHFAKWSDALPEILQQAYGIEEYYPLSVDVWK